MAMYFNPAYDYKAQYDKRKMEGAPQSELDQIATLRAQKQQSMGMPVDDISAVKSTSGTYVPGQGYTQAKPKFSAQDAIEQYTKMRVRAIQEAAMRNESKLNSQLPQITQNYNTVRNNITTNARRDALGNEEALANQGLGRGASSMPTSGYGETSRIAQTTNMQNNLSAADLQEMKDKQTIKQAIIDNGMAASEQEANAVADAALQRVQMGYQESRDNIADKFTMAGLTGDLDGKRTLQGQAFTADQEQRLLDNTFRQEQADIQKEQWNQTWERTISRDKKEDAFRIWSEIGTATPDIAEILGLPADAQTLQYIQMQFENDMRKQEFAQNAAIANENMALNREQFEWQKKKVGSGGGGSGTGKPSDEDVKWPTTKNPLDTATLSDTSKPLPAFTGNTAYIQGGGRVSRAELDALIASGEVEAYQNDDGTLYFRYKR